MSKSLPYRANQKEMIRRICDESGLPREKGESLWWAVVRVIREELLAGKEVQLYGMGGFRFHRFRAVGFGKAYTRKRLLFKTSTRFKEHLQKVTALNLHIPPDWAKIKRERAERKA